MKKLLLVMILGFCSIGLTTTSFASFNSVQPSTQSTTIHKKMVCKEELTTSKDGTTVRTMTCSP